MFTEHQKATQIATLTSIELSFFVHPYNVFEFET